jgi:hypothetical protein
MGREGLIRFLEALQVFYGSILFGGYEEVVLIKIRILGPTTSPPVSTTTSPAYSFDFSMPPPGLSPKDMEQANNAFKQLFPS